MLSQACCKISELSDAERIIISVFLLLINELASEPDLSISNSSDPFKDPVAEVRSSHEWVTTKGNLIKVYTNARGQVNFEIFKGPDRGVHRFYDPDKLREGQTGVEDPNTGERRHD